MYDTPPITAANARSTPAVPRSLVLIESFNPETADLACMGIPSVVDTNWHLWPE
jgi:hypothetical protein